MRTCAVGLGLLIVAGACNETGEPAPTPRKVERRVDPARIGVPNHGAAMQPGEREARRTESAPGNIEAVIGGQHQEFRFLPYGKNAAIYAEDTGVARIILAGSESRDGYPALHLVLENVRLDEIDQLPATFSHANKKSGRDVMAKIRYHEDDRITWESAPEATKAGTNTITIESVDGNRIRGTFEGVVVPPAERFGDPKKVERGRFEVTVRLSGIEL